MSTPSAVDGRGTGAVSPYVRSYAPSSFLNRRATHPCGLLRAIRLSPSAIANTDLEGDRATSSPVPVSAVTSHFTSRVAATRGRKNPELRRAVGERREIARRRGVDRKRRSANPIQFRGILLRNRVGKRPSSTRAIHLAGALHLRMCAEEQDPITNRV